MTDNYTVYEIQAENLSADLELTYSANFNTLQFSGFSGGNTIPSMQYQNGDLIINTYVNNGMDFRKVTLKDFGKNPTFKYITFDGDNYYDIVEELNHRPTSPTYTISNDNMTAEDRVGLTITGSPFDDYISAGGYAVPAKGKNKGKGLTIKGGNGVDNITGTNGADTIYAGKKGGIVDGGAGNDKIYITGNENTTNYQGTTIKYQHATYENGLKTGNDVIYNARSYDTLLLDYSEQSPFSPTVFIHKGNDLVVGIGTDMDTFKYNQSITFKSFFKQYKDERLGNVKLLINEDGELMEINYTIDKLFNTAVDSVPLYTIGKGKIKGAEDYCNNIIGSNKKDTLIGANNFSAVDYLYGGKGKDTLIGGKGENNYIQDILDGADTVKMTKGEQACYLYDSKCKAGGNIKLSDFKLSTKGNDITFTRKFKNGKKVASDSITFKNYDNVSNIISIGLNDERPDVLDNFVFYREGKASGKKGATLTGSNLNEILVGTAKADTLKAAGGRDLIQGGAGNDKLYGGRDVNVFDLSGSHGKDTIYLGAGRNVLYFGNTDDILSLDLDYSRKGNDLIISQSSGDKTTIKNFFINNKDNVVITKSLEIYQPDNLNEYHKWDFEYSGVESLYSLVYLYDNTLFGAETIDKSLSKKGVKITGGPKTEEMIGSKYADTIKSNSTDSLLIGNGGNDKLYGSNRGTTSYLFLQDHGNDTVYMGSSNWFMFDSNLDLSYSVKENDLIISNLNSKGKTETVTVKNYMANENSLYSMICPYDTATQQIDDENSKILYQVLQEKGIISPKNEIHTSDKKAVTIYDSIYDDNIVGSKKNDKLYSYNIDNDEIYGGDGNDKIYANNIGGKYLDGGKGNDTFNINAIPTSGEFASIITIADEAGYDTLNVTYKDDFSSRFYGFSLYFTLSNVREEELFDELKELKYDIGNNLYIIDSAIYKKMIKDGEYSSDAPTSGILLSNYFNGNVVEEINISANSIGFDIYLDNHTINSIIESTASWMKYEGFESTADVFENGNDTQKEFYLTLLNADYKSGI